MQVTQSAKGVLPRHLFAPVHNEISVVERASLHISSFSGSLDVIVIEWMSNERFTGFFHFDR